MRIISGERAGNRDQNAPLTPELREAFFQSFAP